jgi:copper chaperone CopZ
MKHLKILALFFSLSSFGLAEAKTVQVHVNGMVCAFCGQGITKKFSALPEVKKVDVSLKDKIVKLDIEDSANLKDDVIEKVLKESGYQVEKIER